MEKLNLTSGPSSGDNGPVGGKKLNDNFKELVRVLFGVDIWETSSVADVSSYLQQLPTNNNTSILSALLEIYVKDDIIDDDGSASVLKTWSITKLKEYFSNKTELQNALNLKLEKGNYTGNAQDLKDLIDSLQGLATTNQENISTNETNISEVANSLIQNYVQINEVSNYLSGNTYYLDNSIASSDNSEPNNINKPYKDLPDVITHINSYPDDGRPITIYAQTFSTFTGVELPLRNIIWDASSFAKFDFTGVNAITQKSIINLNEGRVVSSVLADNDNSNKKIRTYDFPNGNIFLISNTTSQQQSFSSLYGELKFKGTLHTFDFKCLSGTTYHHDNSVLRLLNENYFSVNFFCVYSINAFAFGNNSIVNIDTLIVKTTDGHSSQTNSNVLNVNTINLNVAGAKFKPSNHKKLTIKNIIGTGKIWTYQNYDQLEVIFDNCSISTTANFSFGGGTIIGNVISTHNAVNRQGSPYSAVIKNFTGRVEDLDCQSIIFEGSNKITTNTNISRLKSNSTINGVTEVITENVSNSLFTTSNNSNLTISGELITNSNNLGVNYSYSNNSLRGVEVQDESGISQWITRQLKFENVNFNLAEKTIEIIKSPLVSSANLIIGGMGTTITNPTILASYLTLDVVNVLDFQIIDNTVYAIINKDYLFNTDAFKDNLDITSYIDKDGYCLTLSNNAFTGCDNLETLSLNTTVYNFLFEGTPMLDISTLSNELITEIKANTFRNVAGDTSFKLSFPSLEIIGSTAFRNVGFYVDLPNYKILTSGLFGVFQGFSGTLNAPKLESLGDPAVNKFTFHQCTNTAILILNYKLRTANNGQPDADLVIAENNGATIVYVGYSELFDEIAKLNLIQYADDTSASTGNVAIGEPYINSNTGAIHLRQI